MANIIFLYEAKSTLYREDNNRSVGRGLFNHGPIAKDQSIVLFKGDKITFEQAKDRQNRGFGGYTIQLTNEIFLDCYNYAFLTDPNERCWGSLANSPLHTYTISTDADNNVVFNQPTSNCNLYINRTTKEARLRAKKNIASDVELLYNYSANYFFDGMF